MWDHAFKVVPDTQEDAATMWFFNAMENPNDAAALTTNGKGEATTCALQYYHKGTNATGAEHDAVPSPEGDKFNECHPWKENACCHQEVVNDHVKIKEAYGEGYEWDRCATVEKPMSRACEAFFVQEACFYECDANAGSYRLCSEEDYANHAMKDTGLTYVDDDGDTQVQWTSCNCTDDAIAQTEKATATIDGVDGVANPKYRVIDYGSCYENRWQMYHMPVKESYCNSWYEACRNDMFCGHGSFFECENIYTAAQAQEVEENPKRAWAVPVAVAGGVAVAVALGIGFFACFLIGKEKAGKSMFAPLGVGDNNDL